MNLFEFAIDVFPVFTTLGNNTNVFAVYSYKVSNSINLLFLDPRIGGPMQSDSSVSQKKALKISLNFCTMLESNILRKLAKPDSEKALSHK